MEHQLTTVQIGRVFKGSAWNPSLTSCGRGAFFCQAVSCAPTARDPLVGPGFSSVHSADCGWFSVRVFNRTRTWVSRKVSSLSKAPISKESSCGVRPKRVFQMTSSTRAVHGSKTRSLISLRPLLALKLRPRTSGKNGSRKHGSGREA